MIFKIRASREVAQRGPEGSGTRRRTVKLPSGPLTLDFGAVPVYLSCDALPPEIASDSHLHVHEVAAESLAPGVTVIDLKSERVQEELAAEVPPLPWERGPGGEGLSGPGGDGLPAELSEEPAVAELKSERVQEELPAPILEDFEAFRAFEAELKSERVQEESAAAEPPPAPATRLKSERVQKPATTKRRR